MPAMIDIPDNIWLQILEEISCTTKTINQIAEEKNIAFNTLWKRLNHPAHLGEYTRAREMQLEYLVLSKTEKLNECSIKINNPKIDPKTKNALVQLCKLELDDINWITSRLLRRYNEKIDHNIIGDNVSKITIERANNVPDEMQKRQEKAEIMHEISQ